MSMQKIVGQLCSCGIPLSEHSVGAHCCEWQCEVYFKGQALQKATGPEQDIKVQEAGLNKRQGHPSSCGRNSVRLNSKYCRDSRGAAELCGGKELFLLEPPAGGCKERQRDRAAPAPATASHLL